MNPTVAFTLNAPLCSSIIPVQLSIDNAPVAVDTFSVNVRANHTTSRSFTTTVGQHTVGARVIGGYVWTDTTVMLQAGQTFIRTLPFYCS